MIERLEFATASEEDRRDLHEVVSAWAVENKPGKEPPSYDACAALWSHRDELGFEPARFVVAREAGRIIGYAQVQVSVAAANAHLALVTVVVLPSRRRRGVGTALLRGVPALLDGRTVIESWSVFRGSPAEHFAAARGFRVVTSMTSQRLEGFSLPHVGAPPAGYRLVTWKGSAPDEFVGACADALNSITDAPFGETTLDAARNTVEGVRAAEAASSAAGKERWVVLLLHDDAPAGVTVVERQGVDPTVAVQLHTAVLPAHRGKGLGRLIKARMLHNLTGVTKVLTRTSTANEPMLRLNRSLGFEDDYVYFAVQAKTADLHP
ncbi:Acetyltransferase (GNAT) family protein [Lentzea fradiae]|uniref:Acetyltransferase (GNAT) family protein n=1 Tax=Lentzea fradiae TaxID=200378 RepID=A0A1G7Q4M9_9PSEU|nr:GNAT family N-acetyltransferase [Lentzea fradiae]SDF93502.1 Acetyltransferase (GNAT) family protein [Lentzea fradiae]